ncbi:hypothetical protein C0991_007777, partial [Blastosporella zonata]
DVAQIVNELIDMDPSVDYINMNGVNQKLEAAMRAEVTARNIISTRLEQTIHLASSLIEVISRSRIAPSKKRSTWHFTIGEFILYTDDASTKNVVPFVEFQPRFMSGEEQLDPVLDAFAAVMKRMCSKLPTLFSNLWLTSTFEFITATCAEPEIEALPLLRGARRFPTFLRDRTGLGVPYALMIYPKSRPVAFVTCFQALPDMNFWIAAINDILSFYKEELAGETVNYIYNRATVENSDPLHVLLALRSELLEASDNVTKALSSSSPKALKAWKDFEAGVM